MTHSPEQATQYKEADTRTRANLWLTFIELRADFDEIEHKELISEMNAFMARDRTKQKTWDFSTQAILQIIQGALVAWSGSFRQTMAKKIQFCTKMCKQALMVL